MDQTAWEKLPMESIPLTMLIWPSHDIYESAIRTQLVTPNMQPINVETLCTGHYYIHDGRHRAMAAYYRGASTIEAYVLDHWAPHTHTG